MSVTNELRKLLDERGVEWKSGDFIEPSVETQWGNNCYTDYPELPPFLTISNCAPEQAIAATLGNGTCKAVPHLNLTIGKDFLTRNGLDCSECGGRLDLPVRAFYCPTCGKKVVDQ